MIGILCFCTAHDLSHTKCISAAQTPLMLAAEEDRPDVVRALLLHGAQVDATSRQYIPISHRLSFQTDTKDDRDGNTSLSLAALRGNANSVAELLRLGAFAGYVTAGCVFQFDSVILCEPLAIADAKRLPKLP